MKCEKTNIQTGIQDRGIFISIDMELQKPKVAAKWAPYSVENEMNSETILHFSIIIFVWSLEIIHSVASLNNNKVTLKLQRKVRGQYRGKVQKTFKDENGCFQGKV